MKPRNIRVRKNPPRNPPRNPPLPSRAEFTPSHWRSARPRDPACWRALLLGTVTMGALCIAAPRAAEAGPQACVINGTEATCSGNQSGGIDAGVDFLAPPVTTLNINNLTQNIGSLASGDAIRWISPSQGPINVTSNTGSFIIDAPNGSGMNLFNNTGQTITVDHTGDIRADIRAITAESLGINANSGAVSVTMTGNALAASGISVSSRVSGAGNSAAASLVYTGNSSGPLSARSEVAGNGNSGPVTVTSNGNITTNGDVFSGILAVSSNSTSAGNGNAGSVTVSSAGNISAFFGIVALSESANGGSADVTVSSSGNITAVQHGIIARSLGGGGAQGNIQVSINGGTVRGGTRAGVEIEGGATNTLAVGSSGVLTSLNGTAITATTGNDTVNNSGVIIGNVELGTGTNAFNNLAGGVFNAGTIVNLGAGNAFTNDGALAPGGAGAAPITTTLTGNFVQNAGGTYAVDVVGAAADRVNVSGTASLAGSVLPTLRGGLTSSTQQFTILHADGGAINNGITLQGGNTLTSKFELLFPNLNDMVLQVTTNLLPTGVVLTPNQRVTAGHLQSALNTGGGNLGAVAGHLAGFVDGKAFAAALDRLHPEPYLAQVQSTWLASLSFADGLMSCSAAGSENTNRFIAEGQCAWLRMGARQMNVDRTEENIGFKDKTWGGSGGAQFAIAPDWFGSFAFGYDNSTIKVDNRASMTGDIFHAGAGIKYIKGNWQIAGALTGGHASYNTTRFAVIPGVSADGDGSLNFLSGRMRVAYVFGGDAAYVKPLVDVDVTGIRRSGIRETGAGPAGLNIRSQTDTLFSVAPAVEVGGEYAYGNALLRPFLRAGVRYFGERDLTATASFIGSPDAAGTFTVTTPIDRWMGEAAAGLDMLSGDRYDARISYEGRFGERSTQHGGNVKLRAKF